MKRLRWALLSGLLVIIAMLAGYRLASPSSHETQPPPPLKQGHPAAPPPKPEAAREASPINPSGALPSGTSSMPPPPYGEMPRPAEYKDLPEKS